MVGLLLEPYKRSLRARLIAHPRFYFFDTGVLNALCGRLTAKINPVLRGKLFEHFVILEVFRKLNYMRDESKLFYWRTNHGAEVDLLIEKHGEIRLAIEIKTNSRLGGRDLSGLRAFANEHPNTQLVVINTQPQAYEIDDIKILPYHDFFNRLPDWLN
ncbi:MAG: DUF4143 domain-containing protein [Deltaproteobacteria bacterium]|nr:DUF4143 domain-containing protein [Deltaproteobacteria bacterium]